MNLKRIPLLLLPALMLFLLVSCGGGNRLFTISDIERIGFTKIENTTSKPLRIIVEFLNEDERVLDVERFDIEANSPDLVERVVFYGVGGKNINILTGTSTLRVLADNLGDGSSVSSNENPRIVFRSGAEFLFRLQ